MKILASGSTVKRPFKPTPATLLMTGFVGLMMTAVSWQIIQSQYGQLVLILLKACFQFIPPYLWLGGLLLAALWLVVMIRVWQHR